MKIQNAIQNLDVLIYNIILKIDISLNEYKHTHTHTKVISISV